MVTRWRAEAYSRGEASSGPTEAALPDEGDNRFLSLNMSGLCIVQLGCARAEMSGRGNA